MPHLDAIISIEEEEEILDTIQQSAKSSRSSRLYSSLLQSESMRDREDHEPDMSSSIPLSSPPRHVSFVDTTLKRARYEEKTGSGLTMTSLDGRVCLTLSVKPVESIKCSSKPFARTASKSVLSMLSKEQSATLYPLDAVPSATRSHSETGSAAMVSSDLWVNRYAPRKYTELISSDISNTAALQWLLSYASSTDAMKSSNDTHVACKKILLIAGRPGLGKTTLAHTLAKLGGYEAIEVNASDERQYTRLRDIIFSTLSMNHVLDGKRKKCLILDEIDGTYNTPTESQSLVQLLVRLASQDRRAGQEWHDEVQEDDEEGEGEAEEQAGKEDRVGNGPNRKLKSKSKKRSSLPALNRPIICICNDLYSPALRELRTVCEVLQLQRPSTSRLVSRLAEICRLEGLLYDPRALSRLVERAEGDLRSCLQSLQFISQILPPDDHEGAKAVNDPNHSSRERQGQKGGGGGLTMECLERLPIGYKEASIGQNYFSLWERLFSSTAQSQPLLQDLCRMSVESLELMWTGAYEHFLAIPFHDHAFHRVLEFYEHWVYLKERTDRFHLSADYLPYTLFIFHALFYSPNVPHRLNWPKSEMQSQSMLREQTTLIQSFLSHAQMQARSMSKVGESGRSYDSVSSYRLHVHTPLLAMISPERVSSLVSSGGGSAAWMMQGEAAEALSSITQRMMTLGLQYRMGTLDDESDGQKLLQQQQQPRSFHAGAFERVWRLDPGLDSLTLSFAPKWQPRLAAKENALRQYLHQQIEVETIKKRQAKSETGPPSLSQLSPTKKGPSLKTEPSVPSSVLHHIAVKKPSRDFFGRLAADVPVILTDTASSAAKALSTASAVRHSMIYYKYHESFANAVRKPAKLKEFLGPFSS